MTRSQRIKHTCKLFVAHALYYLGLLQLWQSIVMRQKAVVLMYHRVLRTDEQRQTASHPAIVVDRDTFAKHMAVLSRRFVVLSLQEFASRLEQRIPFPDSSCVITFDDGWLDNFTNALPILRQHRLPAVVFLPVSYVGANRLFWQEALTHLLIRVVTEVRRDAGRRAAFSRLLRPAGLEEVLDLRDGDPRASIIAAIATQKKRDRAAIDDLLTTLARELRIGLDQLAVTDRFMDWGQVETMSRHGIAFGGHGAHHLLLTQVSVTEAEAEIRTSRQVIVERLREPVPAFSYPNGYVNAAIIEQVKASGYRMAFITKRGLVSCDDDPFTVCRLNVHDDVTHSVPMFLARIVGLF